MLNKLMYETGSGGSFVIYDNDIVMDRGMFTDIYLKLFSSVSSFWANDLFDIDINSQTQQALIDNSLNSRGLENIKRAIESDLAKIGYATFTVNLTVVNDKLEIKINADNNQTLQIVWDATGEQDLTIELQKNE